MKKSAIIPLLILAAACTVEGPENSGTTVLSVEISPDATKTYMAPDANPSGEHQVYWSEGDCLSLNGTASNPLTGIVQGTTSANFTFPGVLNPPYSILYPASFWKNASTITLPAEQTYAAGSFAAGAEPLAGYTADGSTVSVSHLCAMVKVSVKKDPGVSASNLSKVIFKGKAGEQVCGDFTIDYTVPSISGAATGSEGRSLTLNVGEPLDESTSLDIVLIVPAREYASGFTVELIDEDSRTMTKSRSSAITLDPGKLTVFPAFSFVPSGTTTELGIPNIEEEVVLPDGINVTGRVVDAYSGEGLEGVVVSDGLKCVRTMSDGTFYIESAIDDVKFVFVSTPSGYMPEVSDGKPIFYKAKAEATHNGGVYDFGDYVLTPVTNPDRYTLLITADPQPRANNWGLDRIAYKSLDVCEDLYDELADVAAGITDHQVYGICLGDIVHENMDLFYDYDAGLARLGYPTYNIIGNHDNDPAASDDDSGAAPFESHYGPRNYSFNLGGIHYVMLDNLIMKDNGEGSLTAYDQGLTDSVWAWLQADMSFIPTTTRIMVCAHSPMFKLLKGSERTNSAYHAGTRSSVDGSYGYGDLFDKYAEVHAWAGHTHVGLNYIYPSGHRHKNIQVHTLARSTGELWTNEYLAAGTPRGFTVVEVNHDNISWTFHPVTRQRGSFQGASTGYCSAGAPAYDWRDWNYSGGAAVMKDGSGALTEDYQLHAYPRGAYGDEYVYANVFLWDENWELPVWTPDGGSPVTMTRLVTPDTQQTVSESSDPVKDKIYDAADTEFRTWYKTHADKSGASLKGLTGYRAKEVYDADGYITTIFRAPASATPSSGTVSVTDRFGNTYSRRVSW
ncbi:MAG: calcineurin-like phosphoesterase C-terminal domain-containing protein [Bacteroidales bacterium]|nr:calcineurin-like phosphoesterase C-terminal domain-containing protein [Bacteroidales bacterium]